MENTLERFLWDEEFYLSCLKDTINDVNFELLGKYIKEKDVKESFDSAHSLKGVLGNMGLTPLYNIAVEIVEKLRSNTLDENVNSNYSKLIEKRQELKNLLNISD